MLRIKKVRQIDMFFLLVMIAYAFDLEILNMRLHGAFLRYIFLEIGCMKDINGEELGKIIY